jgi:hypothetical protein
MALTASVGELVRIQFPCFDIDGITPMSGLVDADFGKLLLRDNVVSAVSMTITEVGTTGRYVISFTPDADGLWYPEVTTPVEDIFADQVEVGPPPDDWLIAIADAVWAEILPNAFPPNSAGWRLARTDENVVEVHHALIMAVLTASGGDVAHVETNATQADGFYDGLTVVVRDSAGNVARRIATYEQTNGSFVFGGQDLPFTPTAGDEVIVLGILGRVLCENSEEMLLRLIEIHRLMGLDAEYPLCITKTSQEVDDIKLTHTEVGNKLIVRRE